MACWELIISPSKVEDCIIVLPYLFLMVTQLACMACLLHMPTQSYLKWYTAILYGDNSDTHSCIFVIKSSSL